MRNLRNSGLVHDTDYTKHPFGSIQNETASKQGTPVVREVYNDSLMNLYKIIQEVGINFNGLEDNEQNGYQLVAALKNWVNDLNDIERDLIKTTSSTTVDSWSLNLDFKYLKNKYIAFARPSDDFDSTKGNFVSSTFLENPNQYEIQTTGFNSGDELMLIFEGTVIRIHSLTQVLQSTQVLDFVPMIHGNPLSFSNDFQRIWFVNNGMLFSSDQQSIDLKSALQAEFFIENIRDVILFNNTFIFSAWDEDSEIHRVFGKNIDSDSIVFEFDVNLPDPEGVFRDSIMLAVVNEGTTDLSLRFTHGAGSSDNSFDIVEGLVDFEAKEIIGLTDKVFDSEFINSSNSVADPAGIYYLIASNLYFSNEDGTQVMVENVPNYGRLFSLRNKFYYLNGEVAERWLVQLT